MSEPLPANHETVVRRSSADTDGDVQRVLSKLEGNGLDLTVLRILANSPAVFRPFVLFSDALMHRSAISVELRETVILAMAARTQTHYEWAEHVPMAHNAGLDTAQIAALGARSMPSGLFSAEQQLVVAVADGVLDGRGVTRENWKQVTERWGESGALELMAIIGWWGGFVQTMLGALGLVAPDASPECNDSGDEAVYPPWCQPEEPTMDTPR